MKVANATTYFSHILTPKDLITLEKYGDRGVLEALRKCVNRYKTEHDNYQRFKLRNEIKHLERLLRLMSWRICTDEVPYELLGYSTSNQFWG